MPVTTADLGATVCRAILRDHDDWPLIMQTANPADLLAKDEEWTTAVHDGDIHGQWCVILSVQPDKVSVAARTNYWALGRYSFAQLRPDGKDYFKDYLFIQYPADPALITGPAYEAELLEAISKAVAAVNADREARRAGTGTTGSAGA